MRDAMIRHLRRFAACNSHLRVFFALLVFWLASCPLVVAGADVTRRHAYVANLGSDSISLFEINRQGELVKLPVRPLKVTERNPLACTMTPDGKYLYVTNFSGPTVSAFVVTSDGFLRPLGTFIPPNPSGLTQASGIAITPNGAALYVTFYNGGELGAVAGFRVATTGGLTPIGPAVGSGGKGPAGDAISADGRYFTLPIQCQAL